MSTARIFCLKQQYCRNHGDLFKSKKKKKCIKNSITHWQCKLSPTFTLKVRCVYVQNVERGIITVVQFKSKLEKTLDRMHGKELKSRQCTETSRAPTESESCEISVRFVNTLPATLLVPSDRLSGRARRSTRGCERQRSGCWRWWRPAWRTAAWCTPQTQWRGKMTPVEREREREEDLWKKL